MERDERNLADALLMIGELHYDRRVALSQIETLAVQNAQLTVQVIENNSKITELESQVQKLNKTKKSSSKKKRAEK